MAACEVVLRSVGYGNDTCLIHSLREPTNAGTHFFNPATDLAYYGRGNLPGPEPRPFSLPKPSSTIRIVVVGGSSVAGFPYPFELAFPKHLEVLLRLQNPDQCFEVLNAGITAMNSFGELDVIRQALAAQPDLIVIHSGHNEFYGVGGLASTAGGWTARYGPWLQELRRLRSFQLGASFFPARQDKHLLELLPADIAIPRNSPTFRQVSECYRSNLEQMLRLCVRSGVRVLVTTIPANLRDLSPMTSLSNAALSTDEHSIQANRLADAARHFEKAEYAVALRILTEAQSADPDHALIAYRQAQCWEHLRQRENATKAFTLAADLDGCRFRAPSSFAKMLGQETGGRPGVVFFCDVAAQLRGRSMLPVPGNDFFLEHVHYNLDGYWTIAQILGAFIQHNLLHKTWSANLVPQTFQRDELLGVTSFDKLMGESFGLIALQTWPLKLAPDSREQVARATQELRRRFEQLPKLEQELFANLSLAQMQQDLPGSMGAGFERAGKKDKALAMFACERVRRPWDPDGYLPAVKILLERGAHDEAGLLLDRAHRECVCDSGQAKMLEELHSELNHKSGKASRFR